ncbi:hypothetical protein [Ornithinimicrobium flavum]|uniref:hypothetical protein n=1 Tax=Ornithinimicrobium flavum TaxID=1288636 RepID=UPI00106F6D9E|nr:hypothetical protein [Ornithinimicrobium flavum]
MLPLPAGSRLVQRLEFRPRGWPGRVMWWVELPGHTAVMSAMLSSMAREAERRARADGTIGP